MKMPRILKFRRCAFGTALLATTLLCTLSSNAQTTTDAPQNDAEAAMSQQIADLQKVANRWDDAVSQRDQYALELVLSPQFINISETGEVANRDIVVSQMVMKDAPKVTLTQKVTSVRIFGDVAVVNGIYDLAYPGSRLSRTQPKDQKGVFSQVYVRARNAWQCINSQRTLITEMPVKAEKKKSKNASTEKPLNHSLGFSFPGHHSSDTGTTPQQ